MCRNIKVLANFEPPATHDEVRASALQFVRKLSGTTKPSKANEAAFNAAVEEVTAAAHRWEAEARRSVRSDAAAIRAKYSAAPALGRHSAYLGTCTAGTRISSCPGLDDSPNRQVPSSAAVSAVTKRSGASSMIQWPTPLIVVVRIAGM